MNDLLTNVYPDFFDATNRVAAMQFSLNAAIRNQQLPMLLNLFDVNNNVVAVEGDPGWTIERRKPIGSLTDYLSWPSWASFRIYLDPDAYLVGRPECYVSEHDFMMCLHQLLTAYTTEYPQLRSEIVDRGLLGLLEAKPPLPS